MYKHGIEKGSVENEFDRTVNENDESNIEKNKEESEEEMDQNEECDNRIIVDVEIVNVDYQTTREHDEIICENDSVEENNVDVVQIEHKEERNDIKVVNVKIVDVVDDNFEKRTEESDDNIKLVPEKNAGSFVCNICNVVTKSKNELVTHKVSTHHWCIKCFSTFDSRDKLKSHLSAMHKKK